MAKVTSLAEIVERSSDWLLKHTQITLLTPGSTARAIIEAVGTHIHDLHMSLAIQQSMTLVSQATGAHLDLLGEMFGVRRLPAIVSYVGIEDRAVRFYVANGTLYQYLPDPGDLNSGIIPAGTTVQSTDGSVVYTTTEDVRFPRTAREVFAPVQASVVGVSGNVGAHVLRSHSLGLQQVLVTNPVSITTGRDVETDDAYRARISQATLASQGMNETSIRFELLAIPGVADVRIVPYLRGAGSFDVMLIPEGNRVLRDTFEFVSRRLREIVPFGMDFAVREPRYTRISMVISLRYNKMLVGEKDQVRYNVEQAVLRYLGRIRMGEELVITQLGAVILQADERVKDYTIEGLCINGRPQLLHNYKLRDDELFIPDEGLSDPIRVI